MAETVPEVAEEAFALQTRAQALKLLSADDAERNGEVDRIEVGYGGSNDSVAGEDRLRVGGDLHENFRGSAAADGGARGHDHPWQRDPAVQGVRRHHGRGDAGEASERFAAAGRHERRSRGRRGRAPDGGGGPVGRRPDRHGGEDRHGDRRRHPGRGVRSDVRARVRRGRARGGHGDSRRHRAHDHRDRVLGAEPRRQRRPPAESGRRRRRRGRRPAGAAPGAPAGRGRCGGGRVPAPRHDSRGAFSGQRGGP